ncbi:protein kinase [Streptomyces sp. NPDC014684]|uniref:protein kinase domain-containing protein n=1 Tax=Streptomyces sp. NPDC014684 TaxID=3364880 RepID=UPI0036F911E0
MDAEPELVGEYWPEREHPTSGPAAIRNGSHGPEHRRTAAESRPIPISQKPYEAVRRAARGNRKDYALDRLPKGEGGQAQVFMATHKTSGCRVAVKKRSSMGDRGLRRMRREIEVAQTLVSNPHIMPVLDFCPAYKWFVMPNAEATAEERRAELQKPDALRALVYAVASALADAHAADWLHRDIKPSNILLLDNRWTLADWGIVRRPRGQTTGMLTKDGIGTEEFAAPELSLTPHEATYASDIYSLGQVIGWIVTGRSPQANVPLLPDPGHPWYGVIRRATQLDPLQRPQDIGSFLALVTRETAAHSGVSHARAQALFSLAIAGDEGATYELVSLAADHPDNYRLYTELLIGITIDAAGPALARNVTQASAVMRAMAGHVEGNGEKRAEPDEADRVIGWLSSLAAYAVQEEQWQLLDEATRAMFIWDGAFDNSRPLPDIRSWLRTLSGRSAVVTAAVLRDQPESARHFTTLASDHDVHFDIRNAVDMREDAAGGSPPVHTRVVDRQPRQPSTSLPDVLRGQTLSRLYRQADRLDWTHMRPAARVELFNRWVKDPDIGGALLPYLGSEQRVRLWIKDSAMKDFPRAQEGQGPTANYAPRHFRGIEEIAEAACGPDGEIVPESVAIKPNRFIATKGEKRYFVVWGSLRHFRDLMWAIMHATVESTEEPVVVMITRRGDPVNPAARTEQETIARRYGVRLVFLRRDLHSRSDVHGDAV